jgi:hypothetical protein
MALAEIIFKYVCCSKLLMLLPGDEITTGVPVELVKKSFGIRKCIFVRNHKMAGFNWLSGMVHKKLRVCKVFSAVGLDQVGDPH